MRNNSLELDYHSLCNEFGLGNSLGSNPGISSEEKEPEKDSIHGRHASESNPSPEPFPNYPKTAIAASSGSSVYRSSIKVPESRTRPLVVLPIPGVPNYLSS
ncbi:hypothetical protein CH373_16170 [Leptospira perolatii]|uniref:Uncharacterized protein n=1 Tax=Leptospira perolatii TaxID=2023191 RepID=A0A2M9ZJD8_9LEPT|nr:hypothetical protein [Leptospira perolatii]PJZ68432.1 hypothetical protein CH360_16370 [Leptospira perolatii]PJZ72131.1 hypothetical protein CH373_16170 [Leptospira perolatii]